MLKLKRASAFTLVELLAVIGIIAVLMAILLPALSKARDQALSLKCQANLRSLGQAMAMYTQQYGCYPGCIAYDRSGLYAIWPTRLRLFTKNQGVFNCPGRDSSFEWRIGEKEVHATDGPQTFGYEPGERLIDATQRRFSYGYNIWGVGDRGSPRLWGLGAYFYPPGWSDDTTFNVYIRARRVRRPAEMIAIGDSRGDGFRDVAIDAEYTSGFQDSPGSNHRRGANILFCDGHVGWFLQKELINVRSGDASSARIRRMWNNDHCVDNRTP